MAGTCKVSDEPEEKAPSHGQRQLLSDEELLVKHYPRYFYDKKEKFFPVDLNQ